MICGVCLRPSTIFKFFGCIEYVFLGCRRSYNISMVCIQFDARYNNLSAPSWCLIGPSTSKKNLLLKCIFIFEVFVYRHFKVIKFALRHIYETNVEVILKYVILFASVNKDKVTETLSRKILYMYINKYKITSSCFLF